MLTPPPWFWSFRPLAWFWAGVAGLAAGGALVLQLAGPPPVHAATLEPPSSPPRKSLAAPAVAMTGTPIADPAADLLETAANMPGQALPRIAADGRKPSAYYAAAFDPDALHGPPTRPSPTRRRSPARPAPRAASASSPFPWNPPATQPWMKGTTRSSLAQAPR